jgi:hypothetical protein
MPTPKQFYRYVSLPLTVVCLGFSIGGIIATHDANYLIPILSNGVLIGVIVHRISPDAYQRTKPRVQRCLRALLPFAIYGAVACLGLAIGALIGTWDGVSITPILLIVAALYLIAKAIKLAA